MLWIDYQNRQIHRRYRSDWLIQLIGRDAQKLLTVNQWTARHTIYCCHWLGVTTCLPQLAGCSTRNLPASTSRRRQPFYNGTTIFLLSKTGDSNMPTNLTRDADNKVSKPDASVVTPTQQLPRPPPKWTCTKLNLPGTKVAPFLG